MKCSLCERSSDDKSLFEFHHYEPIATRRKTDDGIIVCHQCGDSLHSIFTNSELRTVARNIEEIKDNNKFGGYLNWVKNKPIDTHYSVAAKKRRL